MTPNPYGNYIHSINHIVRFGEVDAASFVYFSRYFEYAHWSYESFLNKIDFSITQFLNLNWKFPLVHSSANYRKPIFLGKSISICLDHIAISNSSCLFHYLIRNKQDEEEIYADISLKHVAIQQLKSIPIPDNFREKLSPFIT